MERVGLKVHFVVGHLADLGIERDHQEDSYSFQLSPLDPELASSKGAIFVVTDGVGGHQAGELASRMAATSIPKYYYTDPNNDVIESLRQAIIAANMEIHQTAQMPGRENMATTVVCAIVQSSDLFVGHAGDSRAYLLHEGVLSQLTEDHSWVVEQLRQKLISEEEAVTHPRRNVITRSLGNKAQVEPEVRRTGRLHSSDRLLLCTDGLYEGVDVSQIEAVLRQYPPQQACQKLVELANSSGGTDNITVVVVEVQLEPEIASTEQEEEIGVESIRSATSSVESERAPYEVEFIEQQQTPARLPEEFSSDEQFSPGPEQLALPEADSSQIGTRMICRWECKISYRASGEGNGFEQKDVIRLPDGRTILCGLTGQKDQFGHQYPVAIEVWVDLDGNRSSRLLVGYGSEVRRLPPSIAQGRKLAMIINGDEMINLSSGPLSVYALVTQYEFANQSSNENFAFAALTVCFRVELEG